MPFLQALIEQMKLNLLHFLSLTLATLYLLCDPSISVLQSVPSDWVGFFVTVCYKLCSTKFLSAAANTQIQLEVRLLCTNSTYWGNIQETPPL